MRWFDHEVSSIYWRQCYSYILCPTVAFFTTVHKAYVDAGDNGPRKNTMLITEVQGTGKSVLGAVIALFFAKSFNWNVTYTWENTKISFGNNTTDEDKEIHVVDLSNGKMASFPSGFVLIISSANAARWHDLCQQHTWAELDGNYCFIDPASKE